ncbi:Transcriptional regulator, LysR family [Cupriavidus taiwanensis]|uniref:LysR family transcriptional regulator n=1 Tax=Cupriavidus taiwanensis TaxID=164546 RepID=UPI000E14C665|nr:LysR family transcriptional regulator [Cupriavidus taiwanensis]SPA02365.1 Transcriptional regulator, LysR family [Cupriavidus taiwanensis]SPA18462.1 Transcriptional regulator, LysR family [Cupriavidus taiwanensis]
MLFSDEITTFLAVVRSGSLLQAAEIVSTTQSTVSYRIQSLERRIGHPLLLRSRGTRNVSLTLAGERFLDIAERWRMLELEAEQLQANQERHLAVGSVDAVAINVLPPFVAALCDEQPPVRLHMESAVYFQLANRVASGHLDIAFTLSPAEHVDLVSTRIRDYPMLVACASSGTAPPPEALEIKDLEPSREIYLPWSAQFDLWRNRRGLSRHVNWVEKAHMLAPMLRNGAWAIVPGFLTSPLAQQAGCTIHRVASDPPDPLSLYMIMRKQGSGDGSARQEQLIETALGALQASGQA